MHGLGRHGSGLDHRRRSSNSRAFGQKMGEAKGEMTSCKSATAISDSTNRRIRM